jgi:hypothetical protein
MRVMIEIDLPDGQKIPTAEDIKQLTDPNWLAEWWHIDDVKGLEETLTDEEAQTVLALVGRNHDCTVGINWDFIGYWVDKILDGRENEST